MGDEVMEYSEDDVVEVVPVDEVQKLQDQLVVAKACARLEEARDTMHADRSEENIEAYKVESEKVQKARTAFREKYPPPKMVAEGDGVATPATVESGVEVHQG